MKDWATVAAFASTLPDTGTVPGRVRNVVIRAWWNRAKQAQRQEFGERP